VAPFAAVLFEQLLEPPSRHIGHKDGLVFAAFGAEPKKLSTKGYPRNTAVVLALQEEHGFAGRWVRPVGAAEAVP
jgi:hypothetical protein